MTLKPLYNRVMKAAIFALALVSGCLAFAQDMKDVNLGSPEFVAKNVSNVFWADDGRSLAYTTKSKDAVAIGLYDLDQSEGKTVLALAKGEEIDSLNWLKAGKKLILVLKSKADTTTYSVIVLDAHDQTARKVWTRQFAKETEPSIEVDLSPSLAHALVTVTTAKTSEIWVLLAGGNGLVFSRDIAAASAQGQSFAGWSTAGTAVFGSGDAKNGVFKLQGIGENSDLTLSGKAVGDVKFTVNLGTQVVKGMPLETTGKPADVEKGIPMIGEMPLVSNLVLRIMPAIAPGASCLECMPSNGSLRPIRFPGYFEDKPGPDKFPDVLSKLASLKLGRTETGSQALWLVEQPVADKESKAVHLTKSAPEPQAGVLVSAQADAWWPSPYTRSIAFSWNGALFVRTVKYGGK